MVLNEKNRFFKLAVTFVSAMAMLSDYGLREAYAACADSGGDNYICSGDAASNTAEYYLDGEPLQVTTESGFGIKTTADDAFNLHSANKGVTFTDEHSSTIIGKDNGIFLRTPDFGYARIKTTGQVIGETAYGIFVGQTTAGLTIDAATVTGGTGGIFGHAHASDAVITTSGIVTGNAGHGIEGSSNIGALSITATAKVLGIGAGSDGINAYIGGGANDLTIKTAAVNGTRYGIYAEHAGSGLVDITTSGAVTGGDTGILVSRTRNSPATINANAAITGTGGWAIDLKDDGHDVINLGPGAVINGSIDFGNGADPVNGNHTNPNDIDTLNALPGFNGVVVFEDNMDKLDTDLESMPEAWSDNIAIIGNTAVAKAVVIDPSGFAASGLFLRSFTGAIFNSIDNSSYAPTDGMSANSFVGTYGFKQRHWASGFGNRQVINASVNMDTALGAGLNLQGAAKSMAGDSAPLYWFSGFGGQQKVDAGDNHVELDHDFAGGMAGAEAGIDGGILGLFGGYGKSYVDIAFDAGSTDVNSIFGGAYWKQDYDAFSLHLALLGGSADHQFQREVTGVTPSTAKGSADGWFISPSATFIAPIKAMPVTTFGSFRASYAGMFLDDYTETGVTTPLEVSDRDIHLLSTRAQLAFPRSFSLEDGSHAYLEILTGLDAHFDLGSDKVTASIAAAGGGGSPAKFSVYLDDEVSGFLGARLTHFDRGGDVSFTLSTELQSTFSGSYEAVGEAKVTLRF
ncbi:MAG: autotransporter domain-containing protein [Gammaproteobacteria bacterium]|nr:autotransporter domain-containing protein [Gammaproteobacteria bacterium]